MKFRRCPADSRVLFNLVYTNKLKFKFDECITYDERGINRVSRPNRQQGVSKTAGWLQTFIAICLLISNCREIAPRKFADGAMNCKLQQQLCVVSLPLAPNINAAQTPGFSPRFPNPVFDDFEKTSSFFAAQGVSRLLAPETATALSSPVMLPAWRC